MVCVDINEITFTLRVGGIALRDNRVMLNKGVNEPYWFIPGGHIEEGEDSQSAIVREMREEIGQDIKIRGLSCVVENFFINKGKKYHEIGIYYSIEVPEPWEGSRYIKDGNGELEYRWLDIDKLDKEAICPGIFKEIIPHGARCIHYIVRDDQ